MKATTKSKLKGAAVGTLFVLSLLIIAAEHPSIKVMVIKSIIGALAMCSSTLLLRHWSNDIDKIINNPKINKTNESNA